MQGFDNQVAEPRRLERGRGRGTAPFQVDMGNASIEGASKPTLSKSAAKIYWGDYLVPRTRSSPIIGAGCVANFGFKSGTRIIDLLVSFDSEVRLEGCCKVVANFGIG